jgi:hypothetical protein
LECARFDCSGSEHAAFEARQYPVKAGAAIDCSDG